MFFDRERRICAAGVPSAQPGINFKEYNLSDEVESLIGDAIKPTPKPGRLPPLRRPIPRDMRNAGPFTEACSLINPPTKTKFQTLVEDVKSTVYSSYWKKEVGTVKDYKPGVPDGLDILNTTFGKKNPNEGQLYDIIMPAKPHVESSSSRKSENKSCSFNPNITVVQKNSFDPRGILVKCCLEDQGVCNGKDKLRPLSKGQVDLNISKGQKLGQSPSPNNNQDCVPKGFSFGFVNPPGEILSFCDLFPEKMLFLKRLGYLNSVRNTLSKRFEYSDFRTLYLQLKYHDTCKTGWLPSQTVYNVCGSRGIRFNPILIEPLLSAWKIFDGSEIFYKLFCNILNYREPTPEHPKVPDIPLEYLDFRSTYGEMVKPNQEKDLKPKAGVPSGRYFDTDVGYCRASLYFQEESNVKSCLNPNVFSSFGVNHRDMYLQRDPDIIRKLLVATGEKVTDALFESVWQEAQKFNSQGLVCIETFFRALKSKQSN